MAMRPPAQIKPWLSIEKMFQWLQGSPDGPSYNRRMAIWLTCTGRLHAHKVAEILGVSTQAVWLWIRQYNTKGPSGLERVGRGGRRWGLMRRGREAEMLKPFLQKARAGRAAKAAMIKPIIEKELSRAVSTSYIYRLLRRHGWAEIIAQSQTITGRSDDFKKLSRPWRRNG